MRALLVIGLVAIILAGSLLTGFYFYSPLRTLLQHTAGSSNGNGNENNGGNNTTRNNHSCSNGATDYPSCNTCPSGESLVNNYCTAVGSTSCSNGANNPTCTSCPIGETYAGTGCYANCVNGNANPPSCDNTTANCHDPSNIQSHLYSPDRLKLIDSCITVGGSVVENGGIDYNNGDADTIVDLKLDPQYQSLINPGAQQYLGGHIQTEIICSNPNAPNPPRECTGYVSHITIPGEKQHVIITGPYVYDTNHHDWAEIHPVYSLTIEYQHNTTITENIHVTYPNYESNGWLGPSRASHLKTVNVKDGLLLVDTIVLNSTSNSNQQITAIYVNTTDLTMHVMSRNPPINFTPGETQKLTFTIDVPMWYYLGPVDLYFVASGP